MTNWGYLQQKKRADKLEEEKQKLKEIVRKLLEKQELTESDKEFLKNLGINDVFG